MRATDRVGDDLYRRLLANDADAPRDLLYAYLDPLASWLSARYWNVDPHHCTTAAEEALLSLIKNPTLYDPQKLSLPAYLRMAVRGDLLNILDADKRHRAHLAPLDDVELYADAGNTGQDVANPETLVTERAERQAKLAEAVRVLNAISSGLTPEEQEVLILMLFDQERKTEPYVQVLRISHLPLSEQRRAVKKVKDKIQKRLRRAAITNV